MAVGLGSAGYADFAGLEAAALEAGPVKEP